jgi:hypothetical protein
MMGDGPSRGEAGPGPLLVSCGSSLSSTSTMLPEKDHTNCNVHSGLLSLDKISTCERHVLNKHHGAAGKMGGPKSARAKNHHWSVSRPNLDALFPFWWPCHKAFFIRGVSSSALPKNFDSLAMILSRTPHFVNYRPVFSNGVVLPPHLLLGSLAQVVIKVLFGSCVASTESITLTHEVRFGKFQTSTS